MGLSSLWKIHTHISLAPPHHASHHFCHTLPWDGILFFNHNSGSVVVLATLAQRACPNWSHNICGFKIRTAGRSCHLLNSQILEVVSNKPHSVEVSARIFEYRVQLWRCGSATGCRILSSYLYAFRLLPMMTNLGFSIDGDAAPNYQKLLLYWCSNQHNLIYNLIAIGRIWTPYWAALSINLGYHKLKESVHTQLCCSTLKCIFLTNVAPFKRT